MILTLCSLLNLDSGCPLDLMSPGPFFHLMKTPPSAFSPLTALVSSCSDWFWGGLYFYTAHFDAQQDMTLLRGHLGTWGLHNDGPPLMEVLTLCKQGQDPAFYFLIVLITPDIYICTKKQNWLQLWPIRCFLMVKCREF